MRGKLHRPVVGGWRGWSRFRRGFGRRRRSGFGRRDRCRVRWIGGRVLSSGGGPRLVLRASSGDGTVRSALRSLPLRSLRTAPRTPTRHHRLGTSFNPRQSNVSRKRSRRRRLQKARCDPQREQHCGNSKERQPSLRPTDPDTHPPLSPGAGNVSPKLLREREDDPWSKHSSAAPAARFDQGSSSRPPISISGSFSPPPGRVDPCPTPTH